MIGKDTVKKKLLEYRVLEIKIHNGKEQWKAKSRPKLVNNNDLEILEKYNKEIRGLYNYYALANNCCILSKLSYIMQYSLYKTFAQKYRTKVSHIKKKYRRNGHFTVRYRLKNGTLKDSAFYHDGFKKKEPMRIMNIDYLPKSIYHAPNTSLVKRLKAETCELCGTVDKLAMHQVRTMKDIKGKTPWGKQMMLRKRKTIALVANVRKNSLAMNRLILFVESRIRWKVYVRFGGECPKTHRSNTAGRWMLSLPLKSVNNLVKDAKKVQKTILMVGDISDIYVHNFQKMMSDPNYTVEELNAIALGYAKLLEQSNDVLNELKGVVNISTLSLTDKERMEVVDSAHDRMLNYRNLVKYYTNKNIGVSLLRAKKKNDTDRVMSLYGNESERYW